ncbi:MAG: histidinol-phosphatase HisJ family protein [Spirochaetaceae bacterium]|nr:MAG: histidinol-phosphatase HisJ family protein [Spirochaetaceae bacterium]
MFDYHLHTPYCRHASGSMDEYVLKAMERAVEEICFTPHLPLPDFPRGGRDLRMDREDLDRYVADVHRLRARFPDFPILCGIEADYYDGYEGYLEKILSRYPFDLVLLSVHFVHSWPGDNWLFGFDFPDKSISQIYSEYFAEIKKALKTGLFDCVAHLDVIKQPGSPVLQSNSADIIEILDLCQAINMSVEINTSGLRKRVAEIYPARDILDLVVARDLPLVTSSDAHDPQSVAHAFPDLLALLKSLPDCRIARYRQRSPTFISARNLG